MPGSALSLFTDFMATTGPAILTGPDEIVNDAQLRNYGALDNLLRAKRDVQGGTQIQDAIMFTSGGQTQTYLSGDTASVTNTQNLTTIAVPWRFVRTPITWTEKEVMLNEGGGGEQQMFHQFKRLKNAKYQAAYTDWFNKVEKLLVATASNANMEAATGTEPYSIFASITSDGLAPSGFTTVQGVNPTTVSGWRNQTSSYTYATPYDTDNGIIAGFDALGQLVQFKKPESATKYFTESDLKSQVILTNKEGRRSYMKALRNANDLTRVGPQDAAYGDPVFNNVPVQFVDAFDTESVFTAGQPGFLFVNWKFIKIVFHRQKWMQLSDVLTPYDKPDTRVAYLDTWANVFQSSRKRQGYLVAA